MTDHAVTSLNNDPVSRGDLRIKCSCGWTEKTSNRFRGISGELIPWARWYIEDKLMFQWECHAYTPEERLILMELEGREIPEEHWKR